MPSCKFCLMKARTRVFWPVLTFGEDFCDRNIGFFEFDLVELCRDALSETSRDKLPFVLITTFFFGVILSKVLKGFPLLPGVVWRDQLFGL